VSTPLHDLDVLRSLAEGPAGVGRDWANLGLAVRAPEAVHDLPADPYDAALTMAAGAPVAADHVRAGLRGHETTDLTAVLAEQLSAFGLAPVGDPSWAAPLREAVRGDGEVRDLYLAQLLADIGHLDGDTLAAASRVNHDDALLALPALVVRFATERGSGAEAAAAVVDELVDEPVVAQPHFAANLLALVGVPHLHVHGDDEAARAAEVAQLMGADVPTVSARGAARRRAQKWVRQLTADRDEPAAHLLGALAARELGSPQTWQAAAVWLHCRDPELGAADAVLRQHAGEERSLLAAARRAIRGGEVDVSEAESATRAALRAHALELCPASLFVADLAPLEGASAVWLDDVLARYQRSPGVDMRHDLITTLQFGRHPERVAQLLTDRATRGAALLFARLTPTEEVLEALLQMPVPGEENERVLYAQALAEMGSPAVAQALSSLRDQPDRTGEVAAACARAEAILQRPLA